MTGNLPPSDLLFK